MEYRRLLICIVLSLIPHPTASSPILPSAPTRDGFSPNIQMLAELSPTNLNPNMADGTDIVKSLIAPPLPVLLYLNELEAFVFRTELQDDQQEKLHIYLAQGERSVDHANATAKSKTLSELGSLTVSTGVRDYMMLWTPRESDGIKMGGDDYYLVFKRSTYWGWRKEIVYETDYMAIAPSRRKLIVLQD